LILLLVIVMRCRCGAKYWCWTKPADPSENKKWNKLVEGGPNWGYCVDPEEAKDELLEYKITTYTSNIEGAGAKGMFTIKLFGDEGMTEDMVLTKDGFLKGETNEGIIKAARIGDPYKIILTNKGKESFRCLFIRV